MPRTKYDKNTVETPANPTADMQEKTKDGESLNTLNLPEFARSSSFSSDDYQSDCSSEDHPLVKKSSIRRRGSPPPNKSVSFNQNVMRQTEYRLTVERLKPAADPMPSQWFGPYYDYEHSYLQYYQPHGGHYYGYYEQAPKRSGHKNRHRNRRKNRRSRHQPYQPQPHNPSTTLSAWIDRDN